MTHRFDRAHPPPGPAAEPPPSLFDDLPVYVAPPPQETIQQAFEEFHAANPWVYAALVRLARDLTARGHRRVGIGMLFEVLRWQYAMRTEDIHSDFKLNNNYRSRYARLIMDRETDLDGVFELRKLTS